MDSQNQQLNKRQDQILFYLNQEKNLTISDLFRYLKKLGFAISKITVNRDLKKLLDLELINIKGKGRSVQYEISPQYNLVKDLDVTAYFEIATDKRIVKERFNFDIFSSLKDIFTEEEKDFLKNLNQIYLKNLKKISSHILKKELERLTIELSWKSSAIEGNTYTLLETERLILNQKEAKGKAKEEAIMILNHKKAIDYIKEKKTFFKSISISKIESVHSLLIDKLNVSKNLRKIIVRITGTKYLPLDNQFQIREALEKTCEIVNKEKNPFTKALIFMIMTAYIQPFEDGNKRTSRIIGNAILIAHNICPLSYRSLDELEYKKAIILFYEQNNLSYFKHLFLEQFKFAVENYF
ncbi:hypothetical protein A2335_00440 [Candidatus Peregrinibacteria bacterium RIFOXYB2_FULL_32_7]|nr:MAG: hypothetical protein A2335_00440 [Candidatus Peregrinibacteria bacterium RIFOXYB2_FULL_32_7]